jgi:hypothetical protein
MEFNMKYGICLFLIIIVNCKIFGQTYGIIQIDVFGPVQFIVTDSTGDKSGYDPRNLNEYNNIENMSYGVGGLSIQEASNIEDTSAWEFGTNDVITDSSFQMKYTVEIIGENIGYYKIEGALIQDLLGHRKNINKNGVLDSLQSVFYRMSYSTNPNFTPVFTKIVSAPTIRQDLENCYKLNLIRNQSLFSNLLSSVNRVDATLLLNDTLSARYNLLQFDIQIDSISNDTLKLAPVGYQILKEDVSQMFTDLPPHIKPSTPDPKYNLNLNKIGNGTITPSPEQTLYDSATTVTLTANPSTGYRFVSWSGDAVGTTNPISVLMNSKKTITATFVKE